MIHKNLPEGLPQHLLQMYLEAESEIPPPDNWSPSDWCDFIAWVWGDDNDQQERGEELSGEKLANEIIIALLETAFATYEAFGVFIDDDRCLREAPCINGEDALHIARMKTKDHLFDLLLNRMAFEIYYPDDIEDDSERSEEERLYAKACELFIHALDLIKHIETTEQPPVHFGIKLSMFVAQCSEARDLVLGQIDLISYEQAYNKLINFPQLAHIVFLKNFCQRKLEEAYQQRKTLRKFG